MSTPPLTVPLDGQTRLRLEAAAAAAGLSVEAYARDILHSALSPGVHDGAAIFEGAHDWTEADQRLADYDRTGEHITLDDWVAEFKADVKARLTDLR